MSGGVQVQVAAWTPQEGMGHKRKEGGCVMSHGALKRREWRALIGVRFWLIVCCHNLGDACGAGRGQGSKHRQLYVGSTRGMRQYADNTPSKVNPCHQ